MITGRVIQFRRGRHTLRKRHMLVEIPKIDSAEKASKFLNKEVIWKSPAGKEIKGKVSAVHGNNGVLRTIFERGLPGQSVGTNVEIK
ncbi:MAG: 50S ribosomal protein L35ae [Nanoarchaeota archaeon]|nr:50S ribosomal protein L35ae [Nanoarchaeota archaeon]